MQTFCSFTFHGCAEGFALDVMSEQRTIENDHTTGGCDQKKNRNRSAENQQFPSQDENGINDKARSVGFLSFGRRHSFVIRHSSFGFRHSRHSQLREEKRVNVRRLLDALAQGGTNTVARARARPQ